MGCCGHSRAGATCRAGERGLGTALPSHGWDYVYITNICDTFIHIKTLGEGFGEDASAGSSSLPPAPHY